MTARQPTASANQAAATTRGATEGGPRDTPPPRRSLTRHLLAWSLGALVMVWLLFVVEAYRTGMHEADELIDGHLAGVASLLLTQGETQRPTLKAPIHITPRADLRKHDYQQSMSVVIWDASGRLVSHVGDVPDVPYSTSQGFATRQLGAPPTPWRSFARQDEEGRLLMVLVSVPERDDLADDIASQIVEPGLWMLPVIALALVLAVRRGLRPLYDLSDSVHRLDIHAAEPLHADHEEFLPVADAINELAARYRRALARERELADELAHELRTPLASLTLAADAARHAPDAPAREQALRQVTQDARRAARVLADVLALARASRTQMAEAAQPVDLDALAREVTAEFAQASLDSGHELALASQGPLVVQGHPVLLGLALRNLIENALRHTPPGALVEVCVDPAARSIGVRDAVPAARAPAQDAVAPAATPAPGSPHGLGLGLGHRVVDRIAAIHDARFESRPHDAGSLHLIRFDPPPA